MGRGKQDASTVRIDWEFVGWALAHRLPALLQVLHRKSLKAGRYDRGTVAAAQPVGCIRVQTHVAFEGGLRPLMRAAGEGVLDGAVIGIIRRQLQQDVQVIEQEDNRIQLKRAGGFLWTWRAVWRQRQLHRLLALIPMETPLRVVIAGSPDREKLVAEIWDGERHLAEISIESDDPVLEVYRPSDCSYWHLSLKGFGAAIAEAKHKLGVE